MSTFALSVKLLIIGLFLLDSVDDLHPSTAKSLDDRAIALPTLNGFDHLHLHGERQYLACPF